MAKPHLLENRLRKKLSRFFNRSGRVGDATSVIKNWVKRGWEPVLFGGVLRDLVVFGGRRYPRDVDVVLNNATIAEVAQDLEGQDYSLNRFGGLHVNVRGWSFDLWPIQKTWAFVVDPSLLPIPRSLPLTTFLDIEAVAVSLNENGGIGPIYSHGFFEALSEKCIDINYRPNPFPALAAIRAVTSAARLRYRLSSRLTQYFIQTVKEVGASELVKAQERHYGKVIFREENISELVAHFAFSLDMLGEVPIALPYSYVPEQLNFWLKTSSELLRSRR